MTIHCPFITVIVPVSVINEKFPGGMEEFRNLRPTDTFCTDGFLASYSFMGPHDSRPFAHSLEEKGLVLWSGVEGLDLQFADVAVTDQFFGPNLPCDWLETEMMEIQLVARLKGTPAGEVTYMESMEAEEIQSREADIQRAKDARIEAFNQLPKFVQEMNDYDRRQYFENKKITSEIEKAKHWAWIWIVLGSSAAALIFSIKMSGGSYLMICGSAVVWGIDKLNKCKHMEARFNRGEFRLPN